MREARRLYHSYSPYEQDGFEKLARADEMLECLLRADPNKIEVLTQRMLVQKQLAVEQRRLEVYELNRLMANREKGSFELYAARRAAPLIGKRCLVPAAVFYREGEPIEGVIVRHAGGGLVWVFLLRDQLEYRVWVCDALAWLANDDHTGRSAELLSFCRAPHARQALRPSLPASRGDGDDELQRKPCMIRGPPVQSASSPD